MFGCLRSVPFWLAASLALPAALGFALAARAGVAVRGSESLVGFLIVYPVLEELVFRGLVQDTLQRQPVLARTCWGVNGAIVIAALLFALAHLFAQPWPWALAVLAPGIVFGWAYHRYGTVLAPILLHVLYNAAVVLGGAWGRP